MEHKILLPRGYISWSAMTKWESNKEGFKKEYFAGGEKLDSMYLRFGKSFAKSVEDGTYKKDFPDLPIYSVVEQEIRVDVNGVPILSFMDSYDPINNVFLEYKTGKHPWDRAKVQKHGQLIFYATALYAQFGKMPEYCDLVWLETKESSEAKKTGLYNGEDKKLEFTGQMKPFRRNFHFQEVEKMQARILKNAIEISDAYKEFISNLEI